MPAEQFLREGNLDECLNDLQKRVRRDPSNPKQRRFLFQLYCVLGDWDRALRQLNVLRDLDPESLPMVLSYQSALECEAFRSAVFEGQREPVLFGEPEPWLALLVQAFGLTRDGRYEESADVRSRAFASAPAVRGSLNGNPFEWIADADPRLGPTLEAIVNGRYYWVPFHRIREIQTEPPQDLRDLVWLPVIFTWANGGQAAGLIPTRYPGSESNEDSGVRLARKTVWQEFPGNFYVGHGQRIFATSNEECPLLETRSVVLHTAATEGQAAEPG